MFHRLAGDLHSRLRREHEAVAERFRSGQPPAGFLRGILRCDRVLRTKSDDADVPLALLLRHEARKSPYGIFADHVGRRAVIFRAPAAPKIDDVARAALFHERYDVFGAEKGAAEIGLDDAVPKVFAQIAHARPTRDAPIEMRHNAGVVDQGIDLTEATHSLMHQPAHIFFIAHIGRNRDRFAAYILNLAERLVHALHIRVGEHDLRTCLRYRLCCMPADSLGAARDDNNSAVHSSSPKFDSIPILSNTPWLQYSNFLPALEG